MDMKKFNFFDETIFKKPVSRRKFIKLVVSGLSTLMLSNYFYKAVFGEGSRFNGRKKSNIKGNYDLVLASGKDPYQMTVKAIDAMGGMSRFVKKGSTVVVKPNIGWDRAPEYAADTNPFVVAALVDMCFQAGAKKVNIFDVPCNAKERCYENSGIKKAAEEKGASVYYVDDWNMVEARFDYESPMEKWPIFRDAIECDTFINVPILKHHSLTGLTLSMKNLMGVCGGNRGQIHNDIGRKLVDLTDFINPDLTVIDAYRFLSKHGPSGGNLEDVINIEKLIVATDPTLADVYACALASSDPLKVPNIAEASSRSFGNSDITKANIFKINV